MRKTRRAERRRKERQRALVARAVTLALLLVVLVAIIVVAIRISRKDTVPQDTVTDTVVTQAANPDTQNAQQNTQSTAETTPVPEQPQQTAEVPQPVVSVPTTKEEALNLARFQAMQYDYDKAIATIQSFGGYESDADLVNEISSITAQRDACTAVDVSRTPHVFFHSLINDSQRTACQRTIRRWRLSVNLTR